MLDNTIPPCPALFQSLRLRGLSLRNGIAVSPMTQRIAAPCRGTACMAISGAGLVIMEASGVEVLGRTTPGCLGLYSPE